MFSDINPYVRFVRNQKQVAYENIMCALDNRIFYCTEGNGSMLVDGEKISIRKGTLLFFKSAIPYRYLTSDDPLYFIACNFDFTFNHADKNVPIPPLTKELFNESMQIDNQFIDDEKMFDRLFVLNDADMFEEKFKILKDEYNNKQLHYQRMCSSVLLDIIVTALRIYHMPKSARSKNISEQITTYIKDNYNRKITYTDIAEKFHYHPNYISRLMLKYTGMTPHQFLINYRMSKAIALLQSTDYPIQKIAECVGIPDIANFSKCFKNHTGNSPTHYRHM